VTYASRVALVLIVTLTSAARALPQDRYLQVRVVNLLEQPMPNVRVAVDGASSTESTDSDGKARIRLTPSIDSDVRLIISSSEQDPSKQLVLISPWDKRVSARFAKSSQEALLVVAERGIRLLLEQPKALALLTEAINSTNADTVERRLTAQRRRENVATVAETVGVDAGQLDSAIRNLGQTTKDPYQKGLVAFYTENYPAAAMAFGESLQLAEKREKAAEAAVAQTAFFLGLSLYDQGKYSEAVAAFEKTLDRRPDDSVTLEALGLSLYRLKLYQKAEPLLQRAIAINEKTVGASPYLALSLNALARLYRATRQLTRAEPLLKRALAIGQSALGTRTPYFADILDNWAGLRADQGRYLEAEANYRGALRINEQTLGPWHPAVAISLNNLALTLAARKARTEAEGHYRRALAILEKAYGPQHPDYAIVLRNLKQL
jgi:tetratricopeptide (TPR) repeat protein